MCFRIDSCFGVHVHDDDVDFYAPPPSATKGIAVAPPPRHATATSKALRDGYYYSNGLHAQQGGLHRGNHQPAHADDEASRRKRPAAAPAVAAIGGYATGGDEALKHPAAAAARNSKAVGQHGAGNGAQRYYYEPEQPARKDAAKDYYYPTASTTSDLERY